MGVEWSGLFIPAALTVQALGGSWCGTGVQPLICCRPLHSLPTTPESHSPPGAGRTRFSSCAAALGSSGHSTTGPPLFDISVTLSYALDQIYPQGRTAPLLHVQTEDRGWLLGTSSCPSLASAVAGSLHPGCCYSVFLPLARSPACLVA